MLEHILLTLSLLGLALLLGATAYESVVMAPNFERDIPGSLEVARSFLQRRTPAHYFRVVTPATQLLLLGGVIAGWGNAEARYSTMTALGVLLLLDLITFTFHYPRLALLFKEPLTDDVGRLRRAAREWTVGNHLRLALLVVALLAVLHGFLAVRGLHG